MSRLAEAQHEKLLSTVAERYRRDGYDVVVEPDTTAVPFGLGNYRPDLLARKGDLKVIVEIKTQANKISFDQLRSVTEEVKRHDGWRFVLVTEQDVLALGSASENEDDFTWDEASRRVDDAQRLSDLGEKEAAYLMLWIAFERMMRSQARRIALPVDRLAPAILIRQLYSQREISMAQYDTALYCQEIRNRLVHGFPVADIDTPHTRLRSTLRELLKEWPQVDVAT